MYYYCIQAAGYPRNPRLGDQGQEPAMGEKEKVLEALAAAEAALAQLEKEASSAAPWASDEVDAWDKYQAILDSIATHEVAVDAMRAALGRETLTDERDRIQAAKWAADQAAEAAALAAEQAAALAALPTIGYTMAGERVVRQILASGTAGGDQYVAESGDGFRAAGWYDAGPRHTWEHAQVVALPSGRVLDDGAEFISAFCWTQGGYSSQYQQVDPADAGPGDLWWPLMEAYKGVAGHVNPYTQQPTSEWLPLGAAKPAGGRQASRYGNDLGAAQAWAEAEENGRISAWLATPAAQADNEVSVLAEIFYQDPNRDYGWSRRTTKPVRLHLLARMAEDAIAQAATATAKAQVDQATARRLADSPFAALAALKRGA